MDVSHLRLKVWVNTGNCLEISSTCQNRTNISANTFMTNILVFMCLIILFGKKYFLRGGGGGSIIVVAIMSRKTWSLDIFIFQLILLSI